MGAQGDVLVKRGIFQTAEHVCESLQETPQKNWHLYKFPLTYGFLMFPGGLAGKESTCNVGDLGLIPALGRFSGEGKCYQLQNSGLENTMDCIVHGITELDTTE